MLLFHEYGFESKVKSSCTENGPFSAKRPVKEEHPGPPLSQMTRGSVDGFERESNCQ